MRALEEYNRKRNFKRTPEPAGGEEKSADQSQAGGEFVIQKHAASRLHYDLRLEKDGVFKSWAVPKGPGLKPGERRLAVKVEDHPLEYGDFEGVIPKGEYGGGTVMLWDRGRWAPVARKGKFKKDKNDEDHIDFVLVGQKLRGAWTLVRTAPKPGEDADNWLLIKRRDNAEGESQITELSVATGRTMEQIAADRNRTWTRAGEITADETEVPDPTELKGARKARLPDMPQAALATLAKEAPAGDQWLQEIKFDGYRILARCDKGKVRLVSRNGKDWTRRFPEIAALLENLPIKTAVLDGEIVAYAGDGTTSFRGLQEALSAGISVGLVYQLFDLQHLNGYDLTAVPLRQRKAVLQQLLAASGFTSSATIRYTDHIDGQGPAFAEQACKLGLEGIICKRAEGRYPSGRSKDWLKVKCTGREELLICGYTDPGGSRSGFGSLLLGAWYGTALIYAGKVGTGFSDRDLRNLHTRLRKLEIEESPFDNPPSEKGLHWVTPQLIAEVEFTEWTRDGMLRHPTFRGLREDRDPNDIQLPPGAPEPQESAKAKKISLPTTTPPKRRIVKGKVAKDSADVAGVTLSNASRILYPESGITKLALAQYYEEVADWMLPQLAFRPLSLVRCPEGHTGECFFQKHPRQTLTKSIPRVMIEEKDGPAPYLYVQSVADVIALVQFGALELHVWGSRVDDVEHPDILVFDLDPGPELPFTELLRVAHELRDRLADLGLSSFPRTTGGKGLHLVVPVEPTRNWDEAKDFCQAVAQQQAQADRRRVTSNMAKSRRRGRIFLDYLRNGRGATAIASFSTRARAGAPVAVPVAWDELNEALRPDRYNVENLRRRLSVLKGDPWEGFDAARIRLTDEMFTAVGLK
ncbi:DNA ligase D [Proteobacteria bacterium 005FR1]|nr:DNA ligase D [Proteobacteria bacterium 005FR1]